MRWFYCMKKIHSILYNFNFLKYIDALVTQPLRRIDFIQDDVKARNSNHKITFQRNKTSKMLFEKIEFVFFA